MDPNCKLAKTSCSLLSVQSCFCSFFFLPFYQRSCHPDYFANHIVGIESYRFWKSALLMHQQSDLRRVKACLLFMSNTIPQTCLSVWSQQHFILLSISSFENSLCFHRWSYRSLPRMNTEHIASRGIWEVCSRVTTELFEGYVPNLAPCC